MSQATLDRVIYDHDSLQEGILKQAIMDEMNPLDAKWFFYFGPAKAEGIHLRNKAYKIVVPRCSPFNRVRIMELVIRQLLMEYHFTPANMRGAELVDWCTVRYPALIDQFNGLIDDVLSSLLAEVAAHQERQLKLAARAFAAQNR